MRKATRREFLEQSLFAASAAAAASCLDKELMACMAPARRFGPNDTIQMAVIGCGGRGLGSHVGEFLKQSGVVITAVCDVDESRNKSAVERIDKATGQSPRFEQDMRRLFDDKSIDAVSIATTNHWHSLAAIWAMQSGKHVYVEKPLSHNVFEGRKAVEAARKYNRVCQVGTQIRSNPGVIDAMKYLHDGKLGTIHLARGLCYKSRGSIGKVDGPQPVPAGIDYDLWSGPAPIKPIFRKNFHYDWHWVWDYGNGDLGNQGVHQMDVARWGLGKDSLAPRVLSLGGRFGYIDDGETPNTQLVFHDYGDSQLIFEVRGLKTERLLGAGVGIIFYGSEGYMVVDSYDHAAVFDSEKKMVTQFKGGGDRLHFNNFLDAIRDGKPLNADVLEGHLSAALCHLGNVSYQLGKPAPFNVKTRAFGDDKESYETFGRFEKHLADNGVTLETSQYTLGRRLTVDPKRESIPDDKQADALLARDYRKPYVVPAEV
jgi:predicted dehydrogenase